MLKDVCSKDKLCFYYRAPEDFLRSLWQKKAGVSFTWIMYRIVIIMYMSAGNIAICLVPTQGYVCKKQTIYFTQWAWIAQFVAFVFICAASVGRYVKEKKNPELPAMEKMPVFYMITWCVYTTAAPCALGITFMYWVFFYDGTEEDSFVFVLISYILNPVVILFDFSISAIPYQLLHVYWPILFTIAYITFSIIYQFSGGTGNKDDIPIYPTLDWRNPKIATISCTVSLVSNTVMHCSLCVLNLLKQYLKRVKDRGFDRENSAITP